MALLSYALSTSKTCGDDADEFEVRSLFGTSGSNINKFEVAFCGFTFDSMTSESQGEHASNWRKALKVGETDGSLLTDSFWT